MGSHSTAGCKPGRAATGDSIYPLEYNFSVRELVFLPDSSASATRSPDAFHIVNRRVEVYKPDLHFSMSPAPGENRVNRVAFVLAAVCMAAAFTPCAPQEGPSEPPLIGAAGVPRELGATRDYDRIFATLAAHGIDLFYPTFQYVEAPRAASLGFEADFVPPCRPEDPAFAAMRAHGVGLIVPAGLLYHPDGPLPPLEADPLAALIACAGDVIYGILSHDEPAHGGVRPGATRALYERIKAVAPELPILMVHAPLRVGDGGPGDASADAYLAAVAEHSRHADIVGFDTYPIPTSIQRIGAPGSNEVLDAGSAVDTYLDLARRTAPGKRYLSVIQNFSPASQYAPELRVRFPPELRARARAPSREEMRTMLRTAATSGASIVVWYGGAFTETEDAPEWRATLAVSAELGGNE